MEERNISFNLRENILKWYPFEENAEILKIENSLENIAEHQYDYVILLGALEYAHKLFKGDNPKEQLIEYSKKHLKKDGKILIITNNKIALGEFCKITKREENDKKINRKNLEKLLDKCNMKYRKFYYVLPDYNTTNVIFTDEFMPNRETLSRDITLYDVQDIPLRSQRKSFIKLIEENVELFKELANTFFVECRNSEIKDNNIKFVSFSNIRKQEYSIQTVIKDDKVYKTAGNSNAINHIENIKKNIDILKELGFKSLDTYENNTIISEYQKNGQTLDNVIMKKIKDNRKEEAIELIKKFCEELKFKLSKKTVNENAFEKYGITHNSELIKKLTYTKYGIWDMIFQNVFYINEEFYFFDQEWREEGIPIEYIVYRSIQYTKGLKEKINVDRIWEYIGINEEHIRLFQQLDNVLQAQIRDNEIWNWHIKSNTTINEAIKETERVRQYKEQIVSDCEKLLNEKDARIKFLEENMEQTVNLLHQRENELAIIKSSRLWKIVNKFKSEEKKGE